jgi:hypothetical protein
VFVTQQARWQHAIPIILEYFFARGVQAIALQTFPWWTNKDHLWLKVETML